MKVIKHACRAIRGAFQSFWFYVGFAYFGVAGMLCTLLGSLLYPVLPRAAAARVGKRSIGLVFRGFLGLLKFGGLVELELSALDELKGQAGIVIAPNHPCLLDAVFVISRVPDVACIMKAEIRDNPVLGGGARLAGYIRNDSGINMVRQSVHELRAGHPLLIFPEGTRTRGKPINQFKGGFALIAKKAGAPIQTVFIECNSAFLSKGWPLFKRPHFPLVYRARLGKRFVVEGDVKVFVESLQQYYREQLSTGSLGERTAPVQTRQFSSTGTRRAVGGDR